MRLVEVILGGCVDRLLPGCAYLGSHSIRISLYELHPKTTLTLCTISFEIALEQSISESPARRDERQSDSVGSVDGRVGIDVHGGRANLVVLLF